MVCRRHLLAAAVASRFPLCAQATGDGLAIINQSDFRLARHADPHRPTVALFLPQTRYPSVVIEMPEHAWRKDEPGGEQVWFYKMYTSDPLVQGNVKWFNTENALSFEMQTPSGFTLRCKAT